MGFIYQTSSLLLTDRVGVIPLLLPMLQIVAGGHVEDSHVQLVCTWRTPVLETYLRFADITACPNKLTWGVR